MVEVRRLKNYINGEWVNSQTSNYEDVLNPATKEIICQAQPANNFPKKRNDYD